MREAGNVFRDLGDPQADLKQAKAILAARIIAALDERELTVRKAASTTGICRRRFLAYPQRRSRTFHAR